MCNCIKEINKNLRESSGDPNAKVLTEQSFIKMPDGKFDIIIFAPVYGKYRTKKKDGTLCDNSVKTPLGVRFCPFCGEKYLKQSVI